MNNYNQGFVKIKVQLTHLAKQDRSRRELLLEFLVDPDIDEGIRGNTLLLGKGLNLIGEIFLNRVVGYF